MSTWTTLYDGHTISVENSWFGGERLHVDGVLQDECLGWASRSRMYGSIRVPGEEIKRIKVSLGAGFYRVYCRIFVDDILVFKGD